MTAVLMMLGIRSILEICMVEIRLFELYLFYTTMKDSDTLMKISVPFSPPDISDLEIGEVVSALKSGWITTGPRTKQFEKISASILVIRMYVVLIRRRHVLKWLFVFWELVLAMK